METTASTSDAVQLRAGVAKADITDTEAGAVNDPLYAKALVVGHGTTVAVLVTVDAVAIAEIGSIRNDFLANVRSQLHKELHIEPAHVLINASHCHGAVCADVEQRTVQAVKEAWQHMVPVTIGAGVGCEDRIMENRRLKLRSCLKIRSVGQRASEKVVGVAREAGESSGFVDAAQRRSTAFAAARSQDGVLRQLLRDGREADVRRAYSLPPDEEVVGVGPVDPEIGILRLDREDGRTLAVVYNFACHPILGVPNRGNTADMTGFASRVIEDNMDEGTIALFLQGCAGDVNPACYKDVDRPRDAEPLGNMLGLSTLQALRKIRSRQGGTLKVIREALELPRADLAQRIEAMRAEQARLLRSLRGTNLNLKTFVLLFVKYRLFPDFPSAPSYRYLHGRAMGRDDLARLDAENRRELERYIENIHIMEALTKIQINLDLLEKHQARNRAAGKGTVEVEVVGMRIGDFVLVAFPGELSVEIGRNIKRKSPHRFTFVAGCTNGYLYYTPTAEQLGNAGGAQEDCECMVAPEWQGLFEDRVMEILERL